MSAERHPNIAAIGLAADVIDAIEHRIRGRAAEERFVKIHQLLKDDILAFVNHVSEKLDSVYESK